MSQQYNIIYMHAHDAGRYVQPYGHAVPTPNIQRLAEEGVLFTKCFSTAPTCSPSRAGLLTGQVPHSCGQFGLVNRGFELRDKEKHLANTLQQAGYHTVSLGVHHVVRDPLSAGYVQRIEVKTHNDDEAVAGQAVEFLANAPDKPFFMAVGFFNTHRVFPEASELDDERYCLPPAPLPNTPETRRDMANFKASARILDRSMGMILNALKEHGLAENTLVICTTDHGLAFPNMKCNLNDHGTGVMLIMRGPEGFGGGKVCDGLVSQLDIYPTICKLIDLEPPDWLQGKALQPLVAAEASEINQEVYAEVNYHCPYEPMRSVRTARWKYIRRYAEYLQPMLANIDESPSKKLWVDNGLAQRQLPAEELYDTLFDPNEANNLAQNPDAAATLADMRGRLQAWMERTADPLLNGPIPAPDDARISLPTDLTPNDLWVRLDKPQGYA